jgi:hypothetical protein
MKSKTNSRIEICSRCHEIADLQDKKVCYWCQLEAASHNTDVYDLPENCRVSSEDLGD